MVTSGNNLGRTASTGEVALALVNTERRSKRSIVDLLPTPEALEAWLLELGLFSATRFLPKSPSDRRILLTEALNLRREIRALFAATSQRKVVPASTLHAVDRALRASHRTARFVSEDDTVRLLEVDSADSPLALVAHFARSAAELVTKGDPDRLRECAAPDCPLWFYDESKGGRRRWCSMARCGNRTKAARHRSRQDALG